MRRRRDRSRSRSGSRTRAERAARDPVGGKDRRPHHDDRVQNLGGGVGVRSSSRAARRATGRAARAGRGRRSCSPRIESPCPAAIDCDSFPYRSSSSKIIGVGGRVDCQDVVLLAATTKRKRQRQTPRERARESQRPRPHFGQPSSARRSCPPYRLGSVRPLAEGLSLARGSVGPVRCQARDVSANSMSRDCPWNAPFRALSASEAVATRGGRRGPLRLSRRSRAPGRSASP